MMSDDRFVNDGARLSLPLERKVPSISEADEVFKARLVKTITTWLVYPPHPPQAVPLFLSRRRLLSVRFADISPEERHLKGKA